MKKYIYAVLTVLLSVFGFFLCMCSVKYSEIYALVGVVLVILAFVPAGMAIKADTQ